MRSVCYKNIGITRLILCSLCAYFTYCINICMGKRINAIFSGSRRTASSSRRHSSSHSSERIIFDALYVIIMTVVIVGGGVLPLPNYVVRRLPCSALSNGCRIAHIRNDKRQLDVWVSYGVDYFSIVFDDDDDDNINNNNSTAEQNNERGVNCSGSCCSRTRVYRPLG